MKFEDVVSAYTKYRECQKAFLAIEDGLLSSSSQDEWIMKLSSKSSFLRKSYKENEELLEKYVRPLIRKEEPLTLELADSILSLVIDMVKNVENDTLLTTEMLMCLKDFYEENGVIDKIILSTFFLGVSYADKVNRYSAVRAYNCFRKICEYKDAYMDIEDFETRKRIIYSFFNSIVNFNVHSSEKSYQIIRIYEEVLDFCNREDIRQLDGDRFDFDQFLEQCKYSVLWDYTCSKEKPSEEVLDYLYNKFELYNVNEDNFIEQKSAIAFGYAWYAYSTNRIDCNKFVSLLFKYYIENEKTIDYEVNDFYEQEEYQTQMVFMQEGFRYLKRTTDDFADKKHIFETLRDDFKHLYHSIPYLYNNSFLNIDMAEIMSNLVLNVNDEVEALTYIQEVIIRRNAMTLIHSTMLGKITELIVQCLVEKAPELFFDLLKTNNVDEVKKQLEYLKRYVVNASYIHDIGKIWISDIINLQTRKLTNEEFLMIKTHPKEGCDMICNTLLKDKYSDIVAGHHRYFNGLNGYPEDFNNVDSDKKILIDIITIGDCIEAATDTLGRNYTIGKTWLPEVANELQNDNEGHYNQRIVKEICADQGTSDMIQYITGLGRVKIYYNIYQIFLNQ